MINQKADINVLLSMLNLSYKMYHLDIACHNIPHVNKSNLAGGGNVIDVIPLMYGPMRNHHLSQKSFGDETQ